MLTFWNRKETEIDLVALRENGQIISSAQQSGTLEVHQTTRVLRRGGRADLARRYLTDYSRRKAAQALELGTALVSSIEARTRLLFGIRRPRSAKINAGRGPTPNCLVGADPDRPQRP